MSLGATRNRSRVVVKSISGGADVRNRLLAMGILPGRLLDVLVNQTYGPVVVSITGSRMVLGRGLANKVIVEEVDGAKGSASASW